jgi:hypothetical protein
VASKNRIAIDRISKIRKIASEKTLGRVDGVNLDTYSASAILAVYEKLSDENKIKFVALPVYRMASIAFKLVG